jgi:hypothetical protein
MNTTVINFEEVVWINFKSKVLVQDKLDRADSFCKIFVILCSLKNIHSPIDQTAKKESGTHRGQRPKVTIQDNEKIPSFSSSSGSSFYSLPVLGFPLQASLKILSLFLIFEINFWKMAGFFEIFF